MSLLRRMNKIAHANFSGLNTVEPIAAVELKTLHTGSLLTRLKSLRALQNCFDLSDWSIEERDAVEAAGLIAFKNSILWEKAFSEVKAELSLREHLPRGSKVKRQEAAKRKQNR